LWEEGAGSVLVGLLDALPQLCLSWCIPGRVRRPPDVM